MAWFDDSVIKLNEVAAMASGALLSEQMAQFLRVVLAAALGWFAIELVNARTEVAIIKEQVTTIKDTQKELKTIIETDLQAIHKRLDNHSAAMTAIINERKK